MKYDRVEIFKTKDGYYRVRFFDENDNVTLENTFKSKIEAMNSVRDGKYKQGIHDRNLDFVKVE